MRPLWDRHRHEFVLAALAAAFLGGAGVADPLFVAPTTQLKLSENIWEMALLALPMTLIIIAGGIDLSVGSAMALATVVFGLGEKAGFPFAVSGAAALLVGAGAGALNGWLVTRMRVHPLLITLGSLAAYRGLAEGLSRGQPVTPLPANFCSLAATVAGVPLPALYFSVLALVAGLFLHQTPRGRFLRVIGHGESAAVFAGVPVDGLRTFLHTVAGLLAGFSALVYAARRNTANPDAGLGIELDVIAAVVVGGTRINGGPGSIPGTLLGILVIHESREFVNWRWSSAELNMIVTGTLLILAVLAHRLLSPGDRTSD